MDGLRLVDGDGAVRLLDHEGEALLLERCLPGTHLIELPEEQALPIACGLIRRWWRPADEPFRDVREDAARWSGELLERWDRGGRPFPKALALEGSKLLGVLAHGPGGTLIHRDFHCENVLAAQREPWLIIDPKPYLGDPALDAATLLRDRCWEEPSVERLRWRLDLLSRELELDAERIKAWGISMGLILGMWSGRFGSAMLRLCERLAAL